MLGCPDDPPEVQETDTEGSSGTGSGTTTTGVDTTADDTGTGVVTSSGSSSSGMADSSSTGPGCTPGEEGCVCDDLGLCAAGLACVEEECVATLCGNGRIDDREACDDGNLQDADGCDGDCTVSAGAREVRAGYEHVCALFHTGQIKCWGSFDSGRLGYLEQSEDVGDDETPADMGFVDVGAPVQQLALGSDFTCVLLETDEVKCWGNGQHGRLGQGDQADLGSDQVPADIPAIDLGGTPIQITAGDQHACATMLSGEVRCWGRNDHGQLGLPGMDMVGDDETPGSVPAIDVGSNVEMVAAGADHTCAILGGGDVLCWGRDTSGQLGTAKSMESIGDNETPSTSLPVNLAEQAVLIEARFDHTCVAYTTNDVQCWGSGGSGRLGYGNTDNVGDDEDVVLVDPVDLGMGDISHIGVGMAHTCVQAGLETYCWGEGDNGRLGYGNTTDLFEPAMTAVNLALPESPVVVTSGQAFTCGVTMGSEVKCWGRNNRGQLGYGTAWDTDLGVAEPIDSIGPVNLE